jgi:hypothetical protein
MTPASAQPAAAVLTPPEARACVAPTAQAQAARTPHGEDSKIGGSPSELNAPTAAGVKTQRLGVCVFSGQNWRFCVLFGGLYYEQYAFILFSTCAFFFAVPGFCADLYALRWWTDASEDAKTLPTDEEEALPAPALSGNRSAWSDDTSGSVQEEPNSIDGGVRQGQTRARKLFSAEERKIDLLAGQTGKNSLRASSTGNGSHSGQNWARNLFSTEEDREDRQDTGHADSMLTVSRALSVAVCLLSIVLTWLSYRALSLSADDCRQGSDSFTTRQALLSFTSALHSGVMRRCPDVWPQLCKSSCDWGNDLVGPTPMRQQQLAN